MAIPFLRVAWGQRGILLTELLVTVVLSGIGMLLLTSFILATAKDSLEFQSRMTAEEISLEITSTILHPFFLIEDMSLSSNNVLLNKNYEALKFLSENTTINHETSMDIKIHDFGGKQLSGTIADPKYFDIYGGHCANPPDLKKCHFKVESDISSYCLDSNSCSGLDVSNIKISYVISKITPRGDYQSVVNKKINMLTSSYVGLTPEVDSIPPIGQLDEITQITVGLYTSCALSNGTPHCWGSNQYYYAVGVGSGSEVENYYTKPQQLTIIENGEKVNISQLASGYKTNCALSEGGQTYCWGFDQTKFSSSAANPKPAKINQDGVQFSSVSVGWGHSCGLDSDGNAYCWGRNREGQSGVGTITWAPKTKAVAVTMPDGVRFSKISAGYHHSCALSENGNAYCWGKNNDNDIQTGVLGDGTGDDRLLPTPVIQSNGLRFSKISAGNTHSCALSTNGRAYCWGKNTVGEIGDNTKTTRFSPKAVVMPTGVKFSSISTGFSNSCATTEEGNAYCWGRDTHGLFGRGEAEASELILRPTPAYRNIAVSQINMKYTHSCAIATDNSYHCAGNTSNGKLGIDMGSNHTPQSKTILPIFDSEFELEKSPYKRTVRVFTCDKEVSDTLSLNNLLAETPAKCSEIPRLKNEYDDDGEKLVTTNWEYIDDENRINFKSYILSPNKWYTFKYSTLIPESIEYLSASE